MFQLSRGRTEVKARFDDSIHLDQHSVLANSSLLVQVDYLMSLVDRILCSRVSPRSAYHVSEDSRKRSEQ